MQINKRGLQLIEKFESLRLTPYKDEKGLWTEGYGHTKGITADSPAIDQSTAENWLKEDVREAEFLVGKYIHVPLNGNQFSALVSLVFNCGYAPLLGQLGQKLNRKDYDGAAQEFDRWDHEGECESNGLLRRREAEKQLFLTPLYEAYYEV